MSILTKTTAMLCLMVSTAIVGVAHADDRPVLNVALQSMGTAGSLDNVESASTAQRKYQSSIFEQLIALDFSDPNLAAKPGLAESWSWISPTQLELKLRQGVTFHNGDPMTADDVVFSFSDERFGLLPEQIAASEAGEASAILADGTVTIVPPATVAATKKQAWPLLDRVEIVDENTVRFVMAQATLDTEARLARLNHASIISKRAFREADGWKGWAIAPVATGPYKVASLDEGAAIRMVPHEQYWEGQPPLAGLNYLVIPEGASRINGLLSGEYDIITDVGPDQVDLISNSDGFDVVGGPLANIRFINLDTRNGPLQNVKVRQALSHTIDHETIVEDLWSGLTAKAHGLQHPMFGDLYIEEHKPAEFDLELAKKLLAEAGYNGEPITFRVAPDYYPNQLTVAQYNLANMEAAGFNIDFAVTDVPGEANNTRMMYDLSNTVHFGYPLAILQNNCPNGGYNLATNPESGTYTNDEFNELCQTLIEAASPEEARAAFARALEILEIEDPAYVLLHQNAILYGKRADIEWAPSAIFAMDFGPGAISVAD